MVKAHVAAFQCSCGEIVLSQITDDVAKAYLGGPQTSDAFIKLLSAEQQARFAVFVLMHGHHAIQRVIGVLGPFEIKCSGQGVPH